MKVMLTEMNNVITAIDKLIAATPPAYKALSHEAGMIRDAFNQRKMAIEELLRLRDEGRIKKIDKSPTT